MQRIFHTPEGVRDIYNGECSQKHHLQTEIRCRCTTASSTTSAIWLS